MSLANPRWGAPRIHGELRKIGIEVSQATVAKYMIRHPKPPSQTWRTFLKNHAKNLVAADFFVVPTIAFQLLFVFVILDHDRRRPIHFAVTSHSRKNGPRDNFSKLSPGIVHRAICSVTATARQDPVRFGF
jgi:hypothetical protein